MMKTIFVVDDNDTNLVAARNALEDLYRTITMSSATKMLKLAERIMPDLILLDVEMPQIDGFAAIEMLRKSPTLKGIPVIFLTARQDEETEIKGFELGAVDFINKPFSVPVLRKRIEMHLETDKLIKRSQASLRNTQNALISVIAELVEVRDKVTGSHIERTQLYLDILIQELLKTGVYADPIASWNLALLYPSAQLHDVGKITISDLVLNKPGKLTPEEFDIIKTHTVEGERIIDEIMDKTDDDGFLNHAKMFAGYHHERWDGSGYPYHLKGSNIPLEGRLMAIADVYDALVSERPYKAALSHEQAVEIILKDSGLHFDPLLVEAFHNVQDDFWVQSLTC
jgi:putative two-component system response regulator